MVASNCWVDVTKFDDPRLIDPKFRPPGQSAVSTVSRSCPEVPLSLVIRTYPGSETGRSSGAPAQIVLNLSGCEKVIWMLSPSLICCAGVEPSISASAVGIRGG